MIAQRLRCLFNSHSPIRDRVHTVGPTFTGTCKVCGTDIYRASHRDWRRGTG